MDCCFCQSPILEGLERIFMKIQKKFIAVFIAATLSAHIVSENAEDAAVQAVEEKQQQDQANLETVFSPVVENKNNLDGSIPASDNKEQSEQSTSGDVFRKKEETLRKINNEIREKQRAAIYELLFGTPDNKAIIRIIRTLKYMSAEDITYFSVDEKLREALEHYNIPEGKVDHMIKNIDRCRSGEEEGCWEFKEFISETYAIRGRVGRNELALMPFGYLFSAAFWERKTKENQLVEDELKKAISLDFVELALNKLAYEARRCKNNETEASAPQAQPVNVKN
jgi:hypothetical protein